MNADKDCNFCSGSGEIEYQYSGEYCRDVAVAQCPCIKIAKQKGCIDELLDTIKQIGDTTHSPSVKILHEISIKMVEVLS